MELVRNRDVPVQWDPNLGIPAIQLHPKTRTKHPTRDQKRDVKMAHMCSLTRRQIMQITHLTQRHVPYALIHRLHQRNAVEGQIPLVPNNVQCLLSVYISLRSIDGCHISSWQRSLISRIQDTGLLKQFLIKKALVYSRL